MLDLCERHASTLIWLRDEPGDEGGLTVGQRIVRTALRSPICVRVRRSSTSAPSLLSRTCRTWSA